MEHNQVFPSHEDMLPNLEAERLEHKLALESLVDADEVALGWRHLQAQDEGECETTSASMCACANMHTHTCMHTGVATEKIYTRHMLLDVVSHALWP